MNAKLKKRLAVLENHVHLARTTLFQQARQAALEALTIEELEVLRQMAERNSWTAETPEQRAAVERCEAEYAAATVRITGRPFKE